MNNDNDKWLWIIWTGLTIVFGVILLFGLIEYTSKLSVKQYEDCVYKDCIKLKGKGKSIYFCMEVNKDVIGKI